ncbi:MAG: hypothetical protein ACTHQM_21725 [Thermoanaerobaculia bacterium]
MAALQIAKWMAGIFVPLVLSFFVSELFGWTDRIQSDALTQAIWDSFQHRRVGGILLSVLTAAGMTVSGVAVSHWMDEGLRNEIVQLHTDSGQPATKEAIVCNGSVLLNRIFSGTVKGNDVTFRVTDLRQTRSGASFKYTLLYGGDVRTDGLGTFDNKTCALTVPEFLSKGHVMKSGTDVLLVAVEPLWVLKRYDTR